jgi:rare lipoprotein A
VRLVINDRGPFIRGRIIDVSRRAAQKLGFLHTGTTRVRVRTVGRVRLRR